MGATRSINIPLLYKNKYDLSSIVYNFKPLWEFDYLCDVMFNLKFINSHKGSHDLMAEHSIFFLIHY